MARVSKVTISLPPAQAAFLERLQARTGTSRSELIALALREAERREREELYAAAYSRHPETEAELAFTDAVTEDFFEESQAAVDIPAVKAPAVVPRRSNTVSARARVKPTDVPHEPKAAEKGRGNTATTLGTKAARRATR